MTNFKTEISKYSQNENFAKEWYIFHTDSYKTQKDCICGHHVKRVTYMYNKKTKHVMFVGTTCAKKYGITQHLKNRVLLPVLKEMIEICKWENNVLVHQDLFSYMRTWIQNRYIFFCNKICDNDTEIDYYDVVAPFRRLLNDVCDLVSDYDYDYILLLREIERDVESMNLNKKHIMVDEYSADEESISEILSESTGSIDTVENITLTIVDTEENEELSAGTPSEVSYDVLPIEHMIGDEEDDAKTPSEVSYDVLLIEDIVGKEEDDAKTPSEVSYDDVIEMDIVTLPIEESIPPIEESIPPIEVQNTIENIVYKIETAVVNTTSLYPCYQMCCNNNIYCFCGLKYRIERLKDQQITYRENIQSMRKETALLQEGITQLNENIAKMKQRMIEFDERIKSNKYISNRPNVY